MRRRPGRVLLPRLVPALLHGEGSGGGGRRNGGRAPEETQAQARDGGDDPARADLRADAPPRHAGADARADLRADHLLGQRRRRDAVPHAGSCAGCEADPQRAPDRVLGLSAVSRRGRDTPPDPPAGHPFPDHGLPDDPGKDILYFGRIRC